MTLMVVEPYVEKKYTPRGETLTWVCEFEGCENTFPRWASEVRNGVTKFCKSHNQTGRMGTSRGIKKLPSSEWTCEETDCEVTFKRYASEVRNGVHRFCPTHNRHPKRGYTIDKVSGYIYLSSQQGHFLASPMGYLYEHRKVLYDSIGPGPHPCFNSLECGKTSLEWGGKNGITVDHIDFNTQNNLRENLRVSCLDCNSRKRRS